MRRYADVAIAGTGLVGAVLARQLAHAGLQVLLLEAGCRTRGHPGGHLRNQAAFRRQPASFHRAVEAKLIPASVPPRLLRYYRAGHPNPAQKQSLNLPAAADTIVFGGMGTLWNGFSVRLRPNELTPLIPASAWGGLYDSAEAALNVSLNAPTRGPLQDCLVSRLTQRYHRANGEGPQPAPLAARTDRESNGIEHVTWTGPAEVLCGENGSSPTLGAIQVRANHSVFRVQEDRGRISYLEASVAPSREIVRIHASVFIVASGAIRSAAVLSNSDLSTLGDPRGPLGRNLYEHPLVYGGVRLDRTWAPEIDTHAAVVIPPSPARAVNSLVVADAYDVEHALGSGPHRRAFFYWYAAGEPRFDNRVVFTTRRRLDGELPQPTFEYRLNESEKQRLRDARDDLAAAMNLVGTALPTAPPQILSAGSSMHVMGTTAMGASDDGTSVADTFGRVWGLSNLYLGGTGLISWATASNPTLTACALAVRTARRILGRSEVNQ